MKVKKEFCTYCGKDYKPKKWIQSVIPLIKYGDPHNCKAQKDYFKEVNKFYGIKL